MISFPFVIVFFYFLQRKFNAHEEEVFVDSLTFIYLFELLENMRRKDDLNQYVKVPITYYHYYDYYYYSN